MVPMTGSRAWESIKLPGACVGDERGRVFRVNRIFWLGIFVATLLTGAGALAAVPFDGRLVDARTGAPVAGAEVTIVGLTGSARSDADGRFTWRPDPRPPFTVLIVLADGRVAKPIYVETADWSAVLTLVVEAAVTEEVTVVAGVAPSIDSAPGAGMTLVTGREIQLRSPNNLVQALENVPGVSRTSEGQAAVPTVRGLARGRTLILLDGGRVSSERRVGASASFLDPASVAGVDVARGPGSVAYGSDALGGVISVRTRRPDRQGPLAVEFTGTLGTGIPDRRGSMVVTKGFGSGGVLVQVHARSADDYDGPDEPVINSGWRDQGFLLRYEQEAAGGLWSFGWQSDYGHDIERPRDNSATTRFYYPFEDSHRFSASFETPNVAGLEQLKVVGLLGSHDHRTDQDTYATATRPRSIARADVSANDFQLRATGDKLLSDVKLEFGLDLNGRFGLEAHDIAIRYDRDGNLVSVDDSLSIDTASRTDTGLFLQAQTAAASAVLLSGGVRGDVVHSVNSGGYFGDRSVTNGALAGFGAVTVGPFDGWTFTGQVSRGFRDPILSDRFYRGPTGRGYITGNPELEPETSLQADFGVRYAISRFRLASYVYHYRISNLIERYEETRDDFTFRNRGEARIRGVELEAQIDAGRGLAVELMGQFSRGDSPDDDVPLDDIPAPSFTVVLRKALWDRGTAYVRAAAFSRDDRPGPSEVDMPGYVELDAGADWQFSPHFGLRGSARNLLNQAYHSSPDSRWVYAPGRSASLTVVVGF